MTGIIDPGDQVPTPEPDEPEELTSEGLVPDTLEIFLKNILS